MAGTRILTWLFITATVVVDCVVLVAAWNQREASSYQVVLEGLILGQVGALAIWTITGRLHRLARGACLVLGTGILAASTMRGETWYFEYWLALLGVYAAIVTAAVAVLSVAQQAIASKREGQQSPHVPLIELFGWTIVVAIASFGARYMDFQIVERGWSSLSASLAIVGAPVLASLLYRPQFRTWQLAMWLALVAGAYLVGAYLAHRRLLEIVLPVQAAYLACWMIVRGVENGEQTTAVEVEESTEVVASDSQPE